MYRHNDQQYKELLKTLPKEWFDFTIQEALLSDPDKLPVDWRAAEPLPHLILNSSVQWVGDDPKEIYYHKSNIWLLFKKDGSSVFMEPEETSGVVYQGSDKRLVKRFDGIPQTMPTDVVRAIRITLGAFTDEHGRSYGAVWHLYAIKH